MKGSATWMNISMLSLKSVQSPQCCCYYHQFYCSVPYIECPCMYNQLICLFLLQYFYTLLVSLFGFPIHILPYISTFSKFLYSSILVQLAMFLLVTSILILNHLLLQFLLCLLFCHSVQWQKCPPCACAWFAVWLLNCQLLVLHCAVYITQNAQNFALWLCKADCRNWSVYLVVVNWEFLRATKLQLWSSSLIKLWSSCAVFANVSLFQ